MYLKRDIDEVLSNWKEDSRRKPVLLRGIRQCGKTSAVRNVSTQFTNFVEINFEKQPKLCAIFEDDIDVKKIVAQLELQFSQKIIPGETLLFIDEIQECPRAVTALRYFYEDMPELHVIAAGSLLEFVFHGKGKEVDFPVGRVRSIYMYPFSFKEYLRAAEGEMMADYLQKFEVGQQENTVHDRLIESYKTFLVVGGMPEAVLTYITTGSLLDCQQVHRDIIFNFIDDFNKYSKSVSADIIRKVFEYALHNVCSQTKASSAISGVSAYYFDESIELLRRAGLVYPVKASNCTSLPLGSTEKQTNKKLIVFDTGVYLTECGLDVGNLLASQLFDDINKGDVVEMQTGLELIKCMSPYNEPSLYYWYRGGSSAEVDYVINLKNEIIPVEVKASGKGRMQSMYRFLDTHELATVGIRVSLEDFSEYDNIHVFPVYAVSKFGSLTRFRGFSDPNRSSSQLSE